MCIAEFEIVIHSNKVFQDTFVLLRDEFASIPFSDKFEYTTIEPSSLAIPANGDGRALLKLKLLSNVPPNKNYKS